MEQNKQDLLRKLEEVKLERKRENFIRTAISSRKPFVASTFEKMIKNKVLEDSFGESAKNAYGKQQRGEKLDEADKIAIDMIRHKEPVSQHEKNELDINSYLNKKLESIKAQGDMKKFFDDQRIQESKGRVASEQEGKIFEIQKPNIPSFKSDEKKNVKPTIQENVKMFNKKFANAIKRTSSEVPQAQKAHPSLSSSKDSERDR